MPSRREIKKQIASVEAQQAAIKKQIAALQAQLDETESDTESDEKILTYSFDEDGNMEVGMTELNCEELQKIVKGDFQYIDVCEKGRHRYSIIANENGKYECKLNPLSKKMGLKIYLFILE